MLTIGMLGGMTCESSLEYYRIINNIAREKLGGNHSARSVMLSVDFGEIEPLMENGEWEKIEKLLVNLAKNIEKAGADFLIICTNTMHKFASRIQKSINIPLLDIIDVTAEKIKTEGFGKIGLLGTRFTMREDFYKKRLEESHGLEIIIPAEEEMNTIHQIIMDELSIGKINENSRRKYQEIINNLKKKGAEGVILGCTEIPLLISSSDSVLPIFDTTEIHARAAVEYAVNDKKPKFRE